MDQAYTPLNVARVATAYAQYVCAQGGQRKGVVVGYDQRLNSENFAEQVADLLAVYGIRVWLSDAACPTPAVSSYVIEQGAFGGVVITASHNPADFNGFKIKDGFGKSADAEVTQWVEQHMDDASVGAIHELPLRTRPTVATVSLNASYLNRIKKAVDLELIARQPLNILVNYLYGSGAGLMKLLFPENQGQVHITEMNAVRDVRFGGINPEPIESNLKDMQKRMRAEHFDLGLVFDGDADRIGALGPGGVFLSSQDIYVLLTWHLAQNKKLSGRIVKSFNITDRLERLAKSRNLPLVVTPIGFKFIAPYLLQVDTLIGGEESGGFGVRYYMPERDGIFCGLLLLEALAMRQQGLSEILADIQAEVGYAAYDRLDLHIESNEKKDALIAQVQAPFKMEFAGLPILAIETLDGIKYRFGDGYWILFRKSGTEPLLRVYAEGPDAESVASLLGAAKVLVG